MDVTRVREQKMGHRVRKPRRDKRVFSRTAGNGNMHGVNASTGRPMRGGIRL